MKDGITIFTPTYNRGYTLKRLYESLIKQTNNNFEWLVIDDGSTDDTRKLILKWIQENKISIHYYYQKNAGKMQAHNKGTQLASFELFSCVDSDDYLTENAIDDILVCWEKIKEDPYIIGIVNFRRTEQGKNITEGNFSNLIGKRCTLFDAYRKHGLRGDTMLIYRTEVIRQFRFPKYDNEKFVPESFLYDRLDQKGEMFIQGEKLYIGEYLPDGYTANVRKVNANNPKGYEAFIRQRARKSSGIDKFLDLIRLQAIEFRLKELNKEYNFDTTILGILALFPGWMFYHKVYEKVQG